MQVGFSAAEIAAEVKGKRLANGGFLIRCPVLSHGRGRGDRNPSCTVLDGNTGRAIFHCFAGCSTEQLQDATSLRGWQADARDQPCSTTHRGANASDVSVGVSNNTSAAHKIWINSRPALDTIVGAYLRDCRKIPGTIPDSLRFHPSVWHSNARTRLPAMVAAVTCLHTGKVTGVHITYLLLDGTGKAFVMPNKRMLGVIKGSGTVLAPFQCDKLIVAEGIETALSVQAATHIPAVAALSASLLPFLKFPDQVRHIVVAADPGQVGVNAAERAARAWVHLGHSVSIAIPTSVNSNGF